MKKIILFFILFIFSTNVFASSIVIDADTNRVLNGNNIHEKKLIASTTKILTALVVIDNCNLNDTVTVSKTVLKSFGSNIYIEVGEKIKVIDLLYGLLLRSGNDAAIILAEYTSSDFIKMMNDYAKKIGMNESNFINPSGLENEDGNGNVSTAYDMALLMSYALKNNTFKKITSTKKYTVKTNYKTYEWYNKNKLLMNYKYCNGGKTGFTKKARRTLVTSASKNNKNVIVVTLNENDDFNYHKQMYEKVFNDYKLVPILEKNSFLLKDYYIKNNIKMLLKEDEINKLKINLIKSNDILNRYGFIEVYLDNQKYIEENVYKLNKKKTLFKKVINFFKQLF